MHNWCEKTSRSAKKTAKTIINMKIYEEVLRKTNSGLEIFIYYLGKECLNKKFKSPFRSDDKRPSCHLYENKNKNGETTYYLQDFGDSRCCGNCFEIAAKVLNININTDFYELLKRIDQDLCLNIIEPSNPNVEKRAKVDIVQIKKEITKGRTSSIKSFTPVIQDFQPSEKEYWGKYGIDEDTLQRYNVHSLKSVSFTKKEGNAFNIYGSKTVPAFGYFFNEMTGLKVYRPKAENRFLYAGNLPSPYVFGWEQLPAKGEFVFITGGEKDVLSLAAHGYSAIAFNSETAKIPEYKLLELSERFHKIIFLYDTDTTGVKESSLRVEEYKNKYNVRRVQLPLAGTKAEKDISDYFALGNSSEDFSSLITNIV